MKEILIILGILLAFAFCYSACKISSESDRYIDHYEDEERRYYESIKQNNKKNKKK